MNRPAPSIISRLSFSAVALLAAGSISAETESSYPTNQRVLFVRGKLEITEPGGGGKKKAVIEHKDAWGVKRYRIPHLTRTPDDRLVVAIVGRCSVGGDHGKSTTFFAVSKDQGETWEHIRHDTNYQNPSERPMGAFPLTERTQETQVVRYLTTPTKGRTRGTLYRSRDLGTTWEMADLLTEGAFAYSSVAKINERTLGIVAERENGDIVFQRVELKH